MYNSCRPNLTSLDLSHNFLNDLEATVVALEGLKTLKSVILTGNPITVRIILAKGGERTEPRVCK